MPDLDGLETARYIRKGKRSKLTPIIFVTAGDDDLEAIARGYSAGAVDYIRKPIQSEVLQSKVKVFIDLHLKNKELTLQAEALARANEEIRGAYQQLETFSYTVAHDLRAPLRTMTGFCEILRSDYADKPFDSTGQQYAQKIEKGARQMDVLIQELLSYCHVAQAKVELTGVDPGEVVREVIKRKSFVLEGHVVLDVADLFPRVVADWNLLDQVISHLISNAATFAKPDVRPHVRIGHEPREGHVRLWVQDNGIGIAREHHDRIFRTFERLHHREDFPGLGMGLAIVKSAVERMSGQVGVESEPGKGSRFWVELPRHRES